VVFVDAHVEDVYPEPRRIVGLEEKPSVGFVSHVINPGTIIAIAGTLYGQAPQAYLVSVRDHDSDFCTCLSPETQTLVDEAVEYVGNLIFEPRPRIKTTVGSVV